MKTLFERIGGEQAVSAAVDLFYQKVLADDRLNHFFNKVDMGKQLKHQKQLFTFAFGGSENYSGRSLRAAHKDLVENMGLKDEHFDLVMKHLGASLKELGVPDKLITEAADIAEATRADVLNRNA